MAADIATLKEIERRLLWLACWTIHNANHLRPKDDGLKVGGHQASCASIVLIMTALYFHALRPEDRVAVKPHGGPVFHAAQYLMGNLPRSYVQNLLQFGLTMLPSILPGMDGAKTWVSQRRPCRAAFRQLLS